MYLLNTSFNIWTEMTAFSAASNTLAEDGFFVFPKDNAPGFSRIAEMRKWFKLPFKWHGMEIWQKHEAGYRSKMSEFRILGEDA